MSSIKIKQFTLRKCIEVYKNYVKEQRDAELAEMEKKVYADLRLVHQLTLGLSATPTKENIDVGVADMKRKRFYIPFGRSVRHLENLLLAESEDCSNLGRGLVTITCNDSWILEFNQRN